MVVITSAVIELLCPPLSLRDDKADVADDVEDDADTEANVCDCSDCWGGGVVVDIVVAPLRLR